MTAPGFKMVSSEGNKAEFRATDQFAPTKPRRQEMGILDAKMM
jgi:hypothetical protein